MVAESSLVDFDLSQNKSLHTLAIRVNDIDKALRSGSLDSASRLFKFALSSIQSPVFSWVRVLYGRSDLFAGNDLESWNHLYNITQAEKLEGALWHHKRFELFCEMHKVQKFQLVLRTYEVGDIEEHTVQMLRVVVAAEKARGGFDDHFPEPLVTFNPFF